MSVVLLALSIVLRLWTDATECNAYFPPKAAHVDLSIAAQADTPDYALIYAQTGLGRQAVDAIWRQPNRAEQLKRVQAAYFHPPAFSCKPNSLISYEERADNPVTELVGLETGDILITPCSHTFGWRNGHAAMVLNAETGETLESVVLGSDSSVQSLTKWAKYPQFAVLRVRGASREERRAAAAYARAHLLGVRYDFSIGVISPKMADEITGTQCAHLVWLPYAVQGIDLDADGGKIVTPADLAASPLLEVVQIYGVGV